MKTCYVFGGCKIEDYAFIEIEPSDETMIICADSGYIHAQNLGLTPDYIIGDFDSAPPPKLANVITLKPEKDETDMLMSIQKGVENGCDNFELYGALGGRFDHSFANIQLLSFYIEKDINIKIIDKNNMVFMLRDSVMEVKKTNKKYLSIFSYSDICEGINLYGVKYSLEDAKLDCNFPLGISNEIVGDSAKISVRRGKLLIVLSSD